MPSKDRIMKRLEQLRQNQSNWPEFRRLKTKLLMMTYIAQDGKCGYCQVVMDWELGPNRMTKEHRIPKSLGSNWHDDPLLTCYTCNNAKGNMSEDEFFDSDKFKRILAIRKEERRNAKWLELSG